MEARHYLTCLWPGMPELWWRGRLSGLPIAIGFALAVNLLLVTRYLYPQWMASGLVSMAFWVGIVVWITLAVRSVRELPLLIAPRSISDEPDRFPEAHQAFLRGNWQKAEDLLTDVLAIEPRDPPALLLLTAVYRHTDRLESADLLMTEIRRLEVADRWWLEVEAEGERLERAKGDREASSTDNSADAADLTAPPRAAA